MQVPKVTECSVKVRCTKVRWYMLCLYDVFFCIVGCMFRMSCNDLTVCATGHHEAEFGMQWCAGFTADFWQAYHEMIPKAPGDSGI